MKLIGSSFKLKGLQPIETAHDIDEDISAKGMLSGVPACHPQPARV